MWKCPACDAELIKQHTTWRCTNNHSYDQAKEGYVNLLLANQKRSKEPGDNKAMINARRAFLERGFYRPLAVKLAELITQFTHNNPCHIFDAGCGEGYYLNVIKQQLEADQKTVTTNGCDISKVAIQKAAKKYKDCHFAVASSFHLPVVSDSQDAVIQVFAPGSHEEVHRILADDGIWLHVSPAANHLHQLKDLIYDTAQTHEANQESIDGFSEVTNEELSFEIQLDDTKDTLNLLMMTPFYWSSPEDKIQQIQKSLKKVTTHFHIRVLQKTT
ncbi:23S rRNA (guanine(745)-N(1))-methyltransferase [Paraneptunicella aestuarii]|uniref:23S rRNA (guanine(745)-N(1))-methyltransferase n=1 Tax=Paraneptunicella aestuarii TaxID=2831148 RepID=UPI001E4BF047|nr:23S rRNA (guanine(745)-N(1))-methyltransferase [Paraneptunicella aestuarii]UAA38203.1 23S rRNA (guanine(745)-N(1))-methyltransferase [Paraneptunicella aestuarii]